MNAALLLAQLAVAGLGLAIAVQGVRASLRERSRRMLAVGGGFAFFGAGSVLETVCHGVFEFSLLQARLIETSAMGFGMVLILSSLFLPIRGTGR